jgi:hypothetical protein
MENLLMLFAFIDTNVLLNYPPLAEIDWLEVSGMDSITIMLCYPVIKELDNMKSDGRFSERAKKRIKEIEGNLGSEIRANVSIEFYDAQLRVEDFPDRPSLESADSQIAHYALLYKKTKHADIGIITEDLGMRLRCRGLGIPIIDPPGNLRLPTPQSEDQKKLREAERKYQDLKNRLPELTFVASDTKFEFERRTMPNLEETLRIMEANIHKKYPRSGTSGHLIKKFLDEARVRIEQYLYVTDRSFRTFKIEFELSNVGNAPAKGVDLTIQFPPEIMAIALPDSLHSNHTETPVDALEFQGMSIPLYNGDLRVPFGLWFNAGPLIKGGKWLADQFQASMDTLPHHDKRSFGPFYLTFDTWENVKRCALKVKIRTLDPADHKEEVIVLEASVILRKAFT